MAWRMTGRAQVDPQNPAAFAVCDRCGFWTNLNRTKYQFEYRGRKLTNIRLRVCERCLDRPAEFLKPIIYPPDPVPVVDPRPENFTIANNGSPYAPPLPWPVQGVGPVSEDVPPYPVYETPPLPPLPPDIESSEP